MKYYFNKPKFYHSMYGEIHTCNHPVYHQCTLFKIGKRGLAVIQQRFNPVQKYTWWSELDPWLTDAIYLNPNFKPFFDARCSASNDGLYPTVTVRQIMWALRMKPVPKEKWETVFDRKDI